MNPGLGTQSSVCSAKFPGMPLMGRSGKDCSYRLTQQVQADLKHGINSISDQPKASPHLRALGLSSVRAGPQLPSQGTPDDTLL